MPDYDWNLRGWGDIIAEAMPAQHYFSKGAKIQAGSLNILYDSYDPDEFESVWWCCNIYMLTYIRIVNYPNQMSSIADCLATEEDLS